MARSSSGITQLFFVLLLVALALFIVREMHVDAPPRQREHRSERRARDLSGILPFPRGFEDGPHAESRRRDHAERVPASCDTFGLTCTSRYFRAWAEPANNSCRTRTSHGWPVPDPRCTPGGINSSVTVDVLRNSGWRTHCIRNCQTSEAQKHVAYGWYGIRKPKENSGPHQVCELDHLVPLEIGGADGLGNIWPECGPDAATLQNRYFKIKDRVENYLADEVKSGRMPLEEAQKGVAADWTQYLAAANRYCEHGGHCG